MYFFLLIQLLFVYYMLFIIYIVIAIAVFCGLQI